MLVRGAWLIVGLKKFGRVGLIGIRSERNKYGKFVADLIADLPKTITLVTFRQALLDGRGLHPELLEIEPYLHGPFRFSYPTGKEDPDEIIRTWQQNLVEYVIKPHLKGSISIK